MRYRLEVFAPDLWTVTAEQAFHRVELGTRMTLVRLGDGRLWVHSPVAIDDALAHEIEALGPVAFVVAPNRLHHLYLASFRQRFPQAAVYLAPRLGRKLGWSDPELSSEPVAGWSADLDQQVIEGIPRFQEVVFLHRPSRSLIVTDAIYDLGTAPSRLTRMLAVLIGKRHPGGLFNEKRLALVKDDDQVARSLRIIAGWDFVHVVMAHGACIRDRGKDEFLRVYAELLDRCCP